MTVCFSRLPCIVHTVPAWKKRSAAVAGRCVCLHPVWPESSDVEYWTRPDWLTAGPAVCSHWQLYQLHLLNYSVHPRSIPKLCQQMLHSTLLPVIRLLRWESPNLIRKGTWPSLVLTFPLLVSLPCLASSLRLSSPVLSLTPRWLLSSRAKWLPRRLLRHWRSLALPFLAVMGTLPLWLLFLQGSGKKAPPAAQLMRVKQPGSHSAVKREKRFSTSSFPLSANRELQKLRALAGTLPLEKRSNQSECHLSTFPSDLSSSRCKMQDNQYIKLHVWPIWMKGIILTIHSPGGSL